MSSSKIYERRNLVYSGGLRSAVVVVRSPDADGWYQCITKGGFLTIPMHVDDRLLAKDFKFRSFKVFNRIVLGK
jgi:hypothetical protein